MALTPTLSLKGSGLDGWWTALTFRLPSWAFYTPDGKNLENRGVAPDLVVENTPEDIAAHHDRQLEVAIQTALNQLGSRDTTARAPGVFTGANDNPNGGSSAVCPHAAR